MKRKTFLRLVCINALIILLILWSWWSFPVQDSVESTTAPDIQANIAPVPSSKHFMVSAFKDHRLGGVIRVISILCKKGLKKVYCVLCDKSNSVAKTDGGLDQCVFSEAKFDIHKNTFPYATASVLCPPPSLQEVTHVSITTDPNNIHNLTSFLPIQNQEVKKSLKYNFTWCISNMFGSSNNAMQFVQTVELYKIIGVQRVVVYKTTCGPHMEKALRYYQKEGILEVVPWPIDKFLKPSGSWRPDYSPGDIHYYGQVATLNDCIYHYMYQSKYLLLNDLDEIIMPYKHANLGDLMSSLQKKHSDASVFRVRNYVFPNTQSDDSGRFPLPEWKKVPGVSLLEHIYREPDNEDSFISAKLIVDPRGVEQTLVHNTQKHFGRVVHVPSDVCRLIHTRRPKKGDTSKDQLIMDKRLWEFEETLVRNINRALHKSGLLP
ncbi:hypothetical protein ACEWY4_011178 [Coilia grayii]|uniref:Glycosyltransferase family 92 protein n=1 Tax=Coilia grayii TaxID=363190 RepID=A0ABD1K403_9TELE